MLHDRLVLFGAGASYGSPAILPVSPPLGATLYKALAHAFPDSWGAVSADLRGKFDAHFETGMAALWDLYPMAISDMLPGAPSPHLLMQDMARFFMSYELAPRHGDSYSQFLIALHNASKLVGTCFSTLNYEHLLEFAMGALGLKRLKQRVVRPHGGCQIWIRRGGRLFGQGRAIGQGMNSISSRVIPLPRQLIEARMNVPRQSQYPCMAIYLPGKVTQMGQRYLWRAQHRFAERVKSAKIVALIGVRPWPEDTHIWTVLRETSATVLYVRSEPDFRDLETLRADRLTKHVGDRFHASIADVVAQM